MFDFDVPYAKAAAKLSTKAYFKWFKLTATLNPIRLWYSFSDTKDNLDLYELCKRLKEYSKDLPEFQLLLSV